MNVYSRNIQYAVIVVSTLPILMVYPFVQKYFVTGMTVGAVKA
jgi:putative aldouronate transport system permease protein